MLKNLKSNSKPELNAYRKISAPLFAVVLALATALATASALAQNLIFSPEELNADRPLQKITAIETDNDRYDSVYSNYIEVCAGSQWLKRGAIAGGNFGHAFAIIHGACRTEDPKSHIPLLSACPGGTVSVSTESVFHNVQWVAAQDRSFILYGSISPRTAVDAQVYDKLLENTEKEGTLNGVAFRADSQDITDRRSSLEFTVGTDFAIALARGVSCTRVPLVGTKQGKENAPLQEVLNHLNELNRKAYASSQQPGANGLPPYGFTYSGMVNNCTHTVSNALAAIGYWKMKDTSGQPDKIPEQLRRIKDIAVPFNTMFDAYRVGNELNVKKIKDWLLKSPEAFRSLKDNGWLGHQDGVIIEDIPAHSFQNFIFEPRLRRDFFSVVGQSIGYVQARSDIKILPEKGFNPVARLFEALIENPETPAMNLKLNLENWKSKYAEALNDPELQGTDAVTLELREHFQRKLSQVELRLEKLKQFDSQILNVNPAQNWAL